MCIADCHGEELMRALSLLQRRLIESREGGRRVPQSAGMDGFNEPSCRPPIAVPGRRSETTTKVGDMREHETQVSCQAALAAPNDRR
jgi:hypothetical protein